MPDYSTFVKQFSVALAAPAHSAPFGFWSYSAGSDGVVALTSASAGAAASTHTQQQQQQQQEANTLARSCESTWRALLSSDAAAKDGGKPMSATAQAVSSCVSTVVTGAAAASNANSSNSSNYASALSSAALAAGGGGGSSATAAAAAAAAATASHYPSIVVGRMTLSTEDRWRIQVQMRREEAKNGQSRKEYNKKVTRAIVSTKGPGADGFAAGRGRPL